MLEATRTKYGPNRWTISRKASFRSVRKGCFLTLAKRVAVEACFVSFLCTYNYHVSPWLCCILGVSLSCGARVRSGSSEGSILFRLVLHDRPMAIISARWRHEHHGEHVVWSPLLWGGPHWQIAHLRRPRLAIATEQQASEDAIEHCMAASSQGAETSCYKTCIRLWKRTWERLRPAGYIHIVSRDDDHSRHGRLQR